MKLRILVVTLIILLTGCDKVNTIPDEKLFEMINDVGAGYDLVFESDNFDTPGSAILVIYAPEVPGSQRVPYAAEIPYTEVRVDDFTMLNIEDAEPLLYSTADRKTSIFMYYGHIGYKDCDFYTINENDTISFKQYDLAVPVGNIVENAHDEGSRYVVFVPRWTTLSNVKSVIDETYQDISDNFACIIVEVSKHIALN